jgi:hypothetical protein
MCWWRYVVVMVVVVMVAVAVGVVATEGGRVGECSLDGL